MIENTTKTYSALESGDIASTSQVSRVTKSRWRRRYTRVIIKSTRRRNPIAAKVFGVALVIVFAVQFWFMIQSALPGDVPKVSLIPPGTTRNLYLNRTAIQLDADKVFSFWAEGANYLYAELAPISDPFAVESAVIDIGVAGAPDWWREQKICYPGPNLFQLPLPREDWLEDPEASGASLYNISIKPSSALGFLCICVQPVILASGAGNLTGSQGTDPYNSGFWAGGLISVVFWGSTVEFGNLSITLDEGTSYETTLKANVYDSETVLPTQYAAQILTQSDYLQFQADLEPGYHTIYIQGDGPFTFKALNTLGSWDDDVLSDVEEAMFEGTLPRVDIFRSNIYGTKEEEFRERNTFNYVDGGDFFEDWVSGSIQFTIPESVGQFFGAGEPLDAWITVSQGVYSNFSLNRVPIEPTNLTLSGFTSDSTEGILITEDDGTQVLRQKRDIIQLGRHFLGNLVPGTHMLEYTYLNDPFLIPEITIFIRDIPVVITSSTTMPDALADSDNDGLPDTYDPSPAASLMYEEGTLLQLVIPTPADGTQDVQLDFSVHPPTGEWNRSENTFRWRADEENSPIVRIRPALVLYGPADDFDVKSLTFWDVPCWDTLAEMASYLGEGGVPLPVVSHNLITTDADGTEFFNYESGVAAFSGDADPLPLLKSAGSSGQYHMVFAEEAQESWKFGPLDYSRDSDALIDGALDLRIRFMWSVIEVDDDGAELGLLGLYAIPTDLTIQAITMKTYTDANYVVGAPRSASEASILTAYTARPDVPISTDGSPASPGKAGMNDDLRNAIIGEGFGLRYLPSYYYDCHDINTWGIVERATYDYHTAYYFLNVNFSQNPVGEFPTGWYYKEIEPKQYAYAQVEETLGGQDHTLCLYDTSGSGTSRPEVITDIAPMTAGSANCTISVGASTNRAEVGFFYNASSGIWPVATQLITGFVPNMPYQILLDYDQPRGRYNVTIEQGDYLWYYPSLRMQNATCPPNQFRIQSLPSSGSYDVSLPYVNLTNVWIWSRRSEYTSEEAGITLYCVTEKTNDILWAINQSIFFQQQVGERFLFYPGNDVSHITPGSRLPVVSVPTWEGVAGDVLVKNWYHGHGNPLQFASAGSSARKVFSPTSAGTLIFEFCPSEGVQAEFAIEEASGIDAAVLRIVAVGERSFLQYKNGTEDIYNWVNLCEVWEGEWFTVQFYEFDLRQANPNFTIFVEGVYAGTAFEVPCLNPIIAIAGVSIKRNSGGSEFFFDAAQLIPSERSVDNEPAMPLDFPSVHFGERTQRVFFSSIVNKYGGQFGSLDENLQGPSGTVFATYFTDKLHEKEVAQIEEFPVGICYRPCSESTSFLPRFRFSDALNISYLSSKAIPLAELPCSLTCPYTWLQGDIPDEAVFKYVVSLETPRWLLGDFGVPAIRFNEMKGDLVLEILDMRPGEVDFLAQLYERHSEPDIGLIKELAKQIIETSWAISREMDNVRATMSRMLTDPDVMNAVGSWTSHKYLPMWGKNYEKYYSQGYWSWDWGSGEWHYVNKPVPIEWTINDIFAFANNFALATAGLERMLGSEIGDFIQLHRQVILSQTKWAEFVNTHPDFFDQQLAERLLVRTGDSDLVASLRSGVLPGRFAFLPDEIDILPAGIFTEVPLSRGQVWYDPDDPFHSPQLGGYLRPQTMGPVGDPHSVDTANLEFYNIRGCYLKKLDVKVTWFEYCEAIKRACTGKPENSFIFKYHGGTLGPSSEKVRRDIFWWRVLGMPPIPSLGDWEIYKTKVAGLIWSPSSGGVGTPEVYLSSEQILKIDSGEPVAIRIYAEQGSEWEQLHGVSAFAYKENGQLKLEGMWYDVDWSKNPSYRPQAAIESGDSQIYCARGFLRLLGDFLQYERGYWGKDSPYTDKKGHWIIDDSNPYWNCMEVYIKVWRMLEYEGAKPPRMILKKYLSAVPMPQVNGKTVVPLGVGALPHRVEVEIDDNGQLRTVTKTIQNLYRGFEEGSYVHAGSLQERLFYAIDAIHNVNKRIPGQYSFHTFKGVKPGSQIHVSKGQTLYSRNPNYFSDTEIDSLGVEEDLKWFMKLVPLLQGYLDYEEHASVIRRGYRMRRLPDELLAKLMTELSSLRLKHGNSRLICGEKYLRVETEKVPFWEWDTETEQNYEIAMFGNLFGSEAEFDRVELSGDPAFDKINQKRIAKGLKAAKNYDHLFYLLLVEGGLDPIYINDDIMAEYSKFTAIPLLEEGSTKAFYDDLSRGKQYKGSTLGFYDASTGKTKLKPDLWLCPTEEGEKFSLQEFLYEEKLWREIWLNKGKGRYSAGDIKTKFNSWIRNSLRIQTLPRGIGVETDVTGRILIHRVPGNKGYLSYLEVEYLQPAIARVPGTTKPEYYSTGSRYKIIWIQGKGPVSRDEAIEKHWIKNPQDPDNEGTGSAPSSPPNQGGPDDSSHDPGNGGKGAMQNTAKQAQDLIDSLDGYHGTRAADDPSSKAAPEVSKGGTQEVEKPGDKITDELAAGERSILQMTPEALGLYLQEQEQSTRVIPADTLDKVGNLGVRQLLEAIKIRAEMDNLIPLVQSVGEQWFEIAAHLENEELKASGLLELMGRAKAQEEIEKYIKLKFGIYDNLFSLIWTTFWSVQAIVKQSENTKAAPGAVELQVGLSSAMVLMKVHSLGQSLDVRAITPSWRIGREWRDVENYDAGTGRAFDSFKFPLLMDFLFSIPDVYNMVYTLSEHGVPTRVAISRAIMQFIPPILIEAVLDFAVSLIISAGVNALSGTAAALLSSSAVGGVIGFAIASLCTWLWNMLVDWFNSQYNNSVSLNYASEHQTLTWEPALARHGGLRVGDEIFYSVAWNNTGASSIWFKQQVSAGSPTDQWGGGSRYTLSNNSHGVDLPSYMDHDPTFMGPFWDFVHNFDAWMQEFGDIFYAPGDTNARWVSGDGTWAGSKYGLYDAGEIAMDYVGRYWSDETIPWSDNDQSVGSPIIDPTGEPADWDFFAHRVPVSAPTTELHLYVTNDVDSWVKAFGGFYRFNGESYTQNMIMGDINGDGWLDPDLERPVRVMDATYTAFLAHCSIVEQSFTLEDLKANLTEAVDQFQWKTASEYLTQMEEFASALAVLDETSLTNLLGRLQDPLLYDARYSCRRLGEGPYDFIEGVLPATLCNKYYLFPTLSVAEYAHYLGGDLGTSLRRAGWRALQMAIPNAGTSRTLFQETFEGCQEGIYPNDWHKNFAGEIADQFFTKTYYVGDPYAVNTLRVVDKRSDARLVLSRDIGPMVHGVWSLDLMGLEGNSGDPIYFSLAKGGARSDFWTDAFTISYEYGHLYCNGEEIKILGSSKWIQFDINVEFDATAMEARVYVGGPLDVHVFPLAVIPDHIRICTSTEGQFTDFVIFDTGVYALDESSYHLNGYGLTSKPGQGQILVPRSWVSLARTCYDTLRECSLKNASLPCRTNIAARLSWDAKIPAIDAGGVITGQFNFAYQGTDSPIINWSLSGPSGWEIGPATGGGRLKSLLSLSFTIKAPETAIAGVYRFQLSEQVDDGSVLAGNVTFGFTFNVRVTYNESLRLQVMGLPDVLELGATYTWANLTGGTTPAAIYITGEGTSDDSLFYDGFAPLMSWDFTDGTVGWTLSPEASQVARFTADEPVGVELTNIVQSLEPEVSVPGRFYMDRLIWGPSSMSETYTYLEIPAGGGSWAGPDGATLFAHVHSVVQQQYSNPWLVFSPARGAFSGDITWDSAPGFYSDIWLGSYHISDLPVDEYISIDGLYPGQHYVAWISPLGCYYEYSEARVAFDPPGMLFEYPFAQFSYSKIASEDGYLVLQTDTAEPIHAWQNISAQLEPGDRVRVRYKEDGANFARLIVGGETFNLSGLGLQERTLIMETYQDITGLGISAEFGTGGGQFFVDSINIERALQRHSPLAQFSFLQASYPEYYGWATAFASGWDTLVWDQFLGSGTGDHVAYVDARVPDGNFGNEIVCKVGVEGMLSAYLEIPEPSFYDSWYYENYVDFGALRQYLVWNPFSDLVPPAGSDFTLYCCGQFDEATLTYSSRPMTYGDAWDAGGLYTGAEWSNFPMEMMSNAWVWDITGLDPGQCIMINSSSTSEFSFGSDDGLYSSMWNCPIILYEIPKVASQDGFLQLQSMEEETVTLSYAFDDYSGVYTDTLDGHYDGNLTFLSDAPYSFPAGISNINYDGCQVIPALAGHSNVLQFAASSTGEAEAQTATNWAATELTIEAWAYIPVGSNQITLEGSGGNFGLQFFSSEHRIGVLGANGQVTFLDTGATWIKDSWIHVRASFNQTHNFYWLNGTLIATVVSGGGLQDYITFGSAGSGARVWFVDSFDTSTDAKYVPFRSMQMVDFGYAQLKAGDKIWATFETTCEEDVLLSLRSDILAGISHDLSLCSAMDSGKGFMIREYVVPIDINVTSIQISVVVKEPMSPSNLADIFRLSNLGFYRYQPLGTPFSDTSLGGFYAQNVPYENITGYKPVKVFTFDQNLEGFVGTGSSGDTLIQCTVPITDGARVDQANPSTNYDDDWYKISYQFLTAFNPTEEWTYFQAPSVAYLPVGVHESSISFTVASHMPTSVPVTLGAVDGVIDYPALTWNNRPAGVTLGEMVPQEGLWSITEDISPGNSYVLRPPATISTTMMYSDKTEDPNLRPYATYVYEKIGAYNGKLVYQSDATEVLGGLFEGSIKVNGDGRARVKFNSTVSGPVIIEFSTSQGVFQWTLALAPTVYPSELNYKLPRDLTINSICILGAMDPAERFELDYLIIDEEALSSPLVTTRAMGRRGVVTLQANGNYVDSIAVPFAEPLPSGTIEFWVYTPGTNDTLSIVLEGDTGANLYLEISDWTLTTTNLTQVLSVGPIYGGWHLLSVTWDCEMQNFTVKYRNASITAGVLWFASQMTAFVGACISTAGWRRAYYIDAICCSGFPSFEPAQNMGELSVAGFGGSLSLRPGDVYNLLFTAPPRHWSTAPGVLPVHLVAYGLNGEVIAALDKEVIIPEFYDVSLTSTSDLHQVGVDQERFTWNCTIVNSGNVLQDFQLSSPGVEDCGTSSFFFDSTAISNITLAPGESRAFWLEVMIPAPVACSFTIVATSTYNTTSLETFACHNALPAFTQSVGVITIDWYPTYTLSYTIKDDTISDPTYILWLSGQEYATGKWQSGVPIAISIDDLLVNGAASLGSYSCILRVDDGYGGRVYDIGGINIVNNILPVITAPSELDFEWQPTGLNFSFFADDESIWRGWDDTFDDGVIDPAWQLQIPSGGQAFESDGILTLATSPDLAGFNNAVIAKRSLSVPAQGNQDFTVTTKLTSEHLITDESRLAGILVDYAGADGRFYFGIERFTEDHLSFWYRVSCVNAYGTLSTHTGQASGFPRYLRVSRRGPVDDGQYSIWYSDTGSDWKCVVDDLNRVYRGPGRIIGPATGVGLFNLQSDLSPYYNDWPAQFDFIQFREPDPYTTSGVSLRRGWIDEFDGFVLGDRWGIQATPDDYVGVWGGSLRVSPSPNALGLPQAPIFETAIPLDAGNHAGNQDYAITIEFDWNLLPPGYFAGICIKMPTQRVFFGAELQGSDAFIDPYLLTCRDALGNVIVASGDLTAFPKYLRLTRMGPAAAGVYGLWYSSDGDNWISAFNDIRGITEITTDVGLFTARFDALADNGAAFDSFEFREADTWAAQTYVIYCDYTEYTRGIWSAGTPITVSLDALAGSGPACLGTHDFTIVVTDPIGGQTTTTSWITIMKGAPVIAQVGEFTGYHHYVAIDQFTGGILAPWQVTRQDAGTTAVVVANEGGFCRALKLTSIASGAVAVERDTAMWSDGTLELYVHTGPAGSSFYVWLADSLGVEDVGPRVIFSADGNIVAHYGDSPVMSWAPDTTYHLRLTFEFTIAEPQRYDLFINGACVATGALFEHWDSVHEVRYIRAQTGAGVGGSWYLSYVGWTWWPGYVAGDNLHEMVTFNMLEAGHYIAWRVTDTMVSTGPYVVTHDGVIVTTGDWVNGISFEVPIRSEFLEPGVHDFQIMVQDGLGYSVSHIAKVYVVSPAGPTILPPTAASFEFGTTGRVLQWRVFGPMPTAPTYVVYRDAGTLLGHYYGTYSFTGTQVGSIPSEWTLPIEAGYTGQSGVIAEFMAHKDVLYVSTSYAASPAPHFQQGHIFNTFTPQASGTIEGYIALEDVAENYEITVTGPAGLVAARIQFKSGGSIQCVNGIDWMGNPQWVNVGTWKANDFYHFSMDFSCASQTYTLRLDGISVAQAFQFESDSLVTSVDMFHALAGSSMSSHYSGLYLDAVGYSFYVMYAIGGNLQYARDRIVYQNGAWFPGDVIVTSLDGLNVGDYMFALVLEDGPYIHTRADVDVTVFNSAPVFDTVPSDLLFMDGTTGHEAAWTVIDRSVVTPTWTLWDGTKQVGSGTWSSGILFSADLDGLIAGVHSLNLIVEDGLGGSTLDEVTVTVNDIPLVVSGREAFSVEAGSVGSYVQWTLTDYVSGSASYSITGGILGKTQASLASGTWSSNIPMMMSLSTLAPGVWSFTLVANDGFGGAVTTRSIAIITPHGMSAVDFVESIIVPHGTPYTYATSTTNIPLEFVLQPSVDTALVAGSWITSPVTATTSFIAPGTYFTFALEHDTPVSLTLPLPAGIPAGATESEVVQLLRLLLFNEVSDTWFTVATPASVDLAQGTVTFTLSHGGYFALGVQNFAPALSGPPDLIYEYGTAPFPLEWSPSDDSIFRPTYEIYMDGALLLTDAWTVGMPITLDIPILLPGSHECELRFIDGLGSVVSDEVTVVVTNALPNITGPESIEYEAGDPRPTASWRVFDASVSTGTYAITRDGTLLVSGLPWISGQMITYAVSGLVPGIYTYTLTASDGIGGVNSAAVLVSVRPDDDTTCVIANLMVVATPHNVTVSCDLIDPSGYSSLDWLAVNGTQIANYSTWMDGIRGYMFFNYTFTRDGTYLFEIRLTDGDRDWPGDATSQVFSCLFDVTGIWDADALLAKIDEAIEMVLESPDGAWRSPSANRKQAMISKLEELRTQILAGNFSSAYDSLLHDIKPKLTALKTDENEIPWGNGIFENPWVIDPDLQEEFRVWANDLLTLLNDVPSGMADSVPAGGDKALLAGDVLFSSILFLGFIFCIFFVGGPIIKRFVRKRGRVFHC